MVSPLVKATNVSWQVNQKPILKNINFAINTGEIVGIIGPNGAGKTSLLRCIHNRIQPTSGTLYYKQMPVSAYSIKELAKHIAVVNQHQDVIYPLTVQTIVEMGLLPQKNMFSRINDEDKHHIKHALNKVGLTDKTHLPFSSLSGGEQQRVLIARAIVQGATLLILDEPTNHLDVFYQHQILSLIHELKLTVIMTIHDLNLAAHYCQRLLLINKGEIIADGAVAEVLVPTRLTEVFRLPCIVENIPESEGINVRFLPLTTGEAT